MEMDTCICITHGIVWEWEAMALGEQLGTRTVRASQVRPIAGNLQIIALQHSAGIRGCSLGEGSGMRASGGVPDPARGWEMPGS